jgi:DNA-binding NtrC family response regulator
MNWERLSTIRSDQGHETARTTYPVLLVVYGPDANSLAPFALRDGVWAIGRMPGDRTVALRDPRASRTHARLHVTHGGSEVTLEDASANGTFLNGRRVDRAPLPDGSVLRIGDTLLLLRYPSPEPRNAAIEGLFGAAPSMCALRHDITRVAPDDATVLVQGESGTGKELVAQSIHRLSGRKGAFVPVNCAAITESVAESLLFGHVAGAFTGARQDHDGYFRAAQGGTLFLDEVGDLPESIQPKLLRAIETGAVLPVGASLPVACKVRLVAATHRDLQQEVELGRFRGDLFARLSQITLRTPPLREHREDILPLLRSTLGEAMNELPLDVVEALLVDPWPYNVRQLLSVGKRVRILGAREGTADLNLFAQRRVPTLPEGGSSMASSDRLKLTLPPSESEAPSEREVPPTKEAVIAAIERFQGNIRRTADALGRSRKQVYRYMDLYGIDLEALRKRAETANSRPQ